MISNRKSLAASAFLAILLAFPASAQEQFDLACRGVAQTAFGPATYEQRFSVDLQNEHFCEAACAMQTPLERVAEGFSVALIPIADVPFSQIRVSFDSETKTVVQLIQRTGSTPLLIHSRCQQTAFSGLQARPEVAPNYALPTFPEGHPTYPSRAIRQGAEGRVVYRVTLDERGRVVDCVILSTSFEADLDGATCTDLRRTAVFEVDAEEGGGAVRIGVLTWGLR
ncbi:MAG: energy transducer TonB [Pseudomonadota bacterium]